jgi:beta-lysine 5,6-aminomutase alpha subunit
MSSKLNLNFELVNKSRKAAKTIALDTQEFIDKHTTVAVERTVCRLLGIDGIDEFGIPLPNIVVEILKMAAGFHLVRHIS